MATKKKTEEVIEEEPVEEATEEETVDPKVAAKLAKFAEEWFATHGGAVADIGFQPAVCDCGSPDCTGVQMVHPHDRTHHYH